MATYTDLAAQEEAKRKALGQLSREEILKLANDYSSSAAKRRAALSQSLLDTGQQTFSMQNPALLEDLNKRGLLNSGTAVSNAQAQALKEIALQNASQLNQFDDQTYNELNSLRGQGLAAELQGNQDALDAGLDLNRAELERGFQQSQAEQEQALAEKLAKQQQKSALYSSLIGTGGSLLGAGLVSKGLGSVAAPLAAKAAVGSVGTGAGLSGGASLGGSASGGAALSGAGFTPGVGSLAAGGIGAMLLSRAAEKKVGQNLGNTVGQVGGIIANPIGKQLNVAKNLVTNPGKTVSNIAKSVGSVFCFEAGTPVTMDDGSERAIQLLHIGAKTKGGDVVSLRSSRTENGTRYLYKGIHVTGSHAVKEDGKWIRVKESPHAALQEGDGIVWSIVTTNHRIWIQGIEMADEHETDQYETLSIDQSLEELNRQEKELVA